MGQMTAARRWKVWLLSVVGLYPMLLVLVDVVTDLTPRWPIFLRLAMVAPAAVAWIVWGVAPIQQRILSGWR